LLLVMSPDPSNPRPSDSARGANAR
jgi:hypothetical protein